MSKTRGWIITTKFTVSGRRKSKSTAISHLAVKASERQQEEHDGGADGDDGQLAFRLLLQASGLSVQMHLLLLL